MEVVAESIILGNWLKVDDLKSRVVIQFEVPYCIMISINL